MTQNKAGLDRKQFQCQGDHCCGHSAPVSERLLDALDALDDLLEQETNIEGPQLVINSGFRCLTHNTAIGSLPYSQHCLGLAADVASPYILPCVIAATAEQIEDFRLGGIGIYPTFVHLDIRSGSPARW
jgi:uncharacterized protein YcbK (DUF882 family)